MGMLPPGICLPILLEDLPLQQSNEGASGGSQGTRLLSQLQGLILKYEQYMVILLSQGVFEDVCELRQHKPGCVFRCEICKKKFQTNMNLIIKNILKLMNRHFAEHC